MLFVDPYFSLFLSLFSLCFPPFLLQWYIILRTCQTDMCVVLKSTVRETQGERDCTYSRQKANTVVWVLLRQKYQLTSLKQKDTAFCDFFATSYYTVKIFWPHSDPILLEALFASSIERWRYWVYQSIICAKHTDSHKIWQQVSLFSQSSCLSFNETQNACQQSSSYNALSSNLIS